MKQITSLLIIIAIVFIVSCKKDIYDTSSSAKLEFSTDSILFDTVFTTVGSTTKILQVYNNYGSKINISSIRLAGGSNSMFSMNVNGTYTTSASNITIAPHDSLFIFVKVSVNPNNKNNPLIVKDSIFFLTNGNLQNVKLAAWGQDAHFIVADTHVKGLPPYKIVAKEGSSPVVWNNDKPYVVYGYAVVDSTGSLTINAGVKVCFYNNSGLWVYKGGRLTVNGTNDNPVIFQGTRLEPEYQNIPGQWDRIWLNEGFTGKDNVINYAIIKNAFIGIQAETLNKPLGNKLELSNTTIENCSGYGILARDYTIFGGNCLIDNCGGYGIALTEGGSYDFRDCTLGNYWNYNARQTPSLVLNNYIPDHNGHDSISIALAKAYFGNCIIWGDLDDEVYLDSAKIHPAGFSYMFDNCLMKTKLKTNNIHFNNVIVNKDPLFVNYNKYDYHLQDTSPAKDAGDYNIILNEPDPIMRNILTMTLDGNVRSSGSIDLGAY